MNGTAWVSIIALVGWLVLAACAIRAQHIGAKKMVVMGLTWAAIFLFVAMAFAVMAGR